MHIFLVGPGSVGKSTVGPLLAERLGYICCDLDHEFCVQVGLIGDYIKEHGYRAYCEANAALCQRLVEQAVSPTVFVTSSGFLVHEELPEIVERNKRLIAEYGIAVLLLPALDL